jgi:transglutaminase-like putative cysteine protease
MFCPTQRSKYRARPVRIQPGLAGLLIVVFLRFVAAAQPQAVNSSTGAREIWAESRLARQPAGYYHEKAETDAGRDIFTVIESDFVMNREGSQVEIKSSSRYQETEGGRLLAMQTNMSSSKQPTHVDVTVKDSSLLIRTSTGEKTYDRTLAFTGTLTGPNAARRQMLDRLKSPGDSFAYQEFSPEFGSVVTLTTTLVQPEQLTIDGKQYSSLRVEQTLSGLPYKVTLWLDNEGWLLRQVLPTPFGDVETVRSQQEVRRLTAGAPLPEEIYGRTIVHANVRLPQQRLIEKLKIRITSRKPELGWPEFNADNQTVLEKTPNYVVLEIRRVLPQKDGRRPVASTRELAPYLAPNPLLQSDDAAVQSIARQVVGDDRNLFRSALALQKWTHNSMQFDMGIAVVPASEVARDRHGTCIGYSILLASLARAAGIPSRVRMGFAYIDGAWGGHAWVEVLIAGDWIALDSALYSPGVADAARFSVFTGSLQEGVMASDGLAQLAGNIDIQTLEYTVGGERFVVPEKAQAFTVEGDTYRNTWLGLTVVKPGAFRFTRLDAVWPENTVLAMEGPNHQSIEIESASGALPASDHADYWKYLAEDGISGDRSKIPIAGHRALVISSPEKAGLVLAQGGDIWVVKATGPQASKLLLDVASQMRLNDAALTSASVPR